MLWQVSPYYPSLQFKRVDPQDPIYSVRVGRGYRALKLAERLDQSERAAAYLIDAPFEEAAQQLLLFDAREPYEAG